MTVSRRSLQDALTAGTVSLLGRGGEGTGVFVAAGLILTCAHVVARPGQLLPSTITGTWNARQLDLRVLTDSLHVAEDGGPDLALLALSEPMTHPVVAFCDQVEPGDELWIYGHPSGSYRQGEPVRAFIEGMSTRSDEARLLRVADGRPGPGHSGAAALNWRTGSVCGVVRLGSRSVAGGPTRLIPASVILDVFPEVGEFQRSNSANRAWFDLMSITQLQAAGRRYLGGELREYLAEIRDAAREHPYPLPSWEAPPLHTVYLRQLASPEPATEEHIPYGPIRAEEIASRYQGAQIYGGAGAGKSSLLRHIADVAATSWLEGKEAEFVPILIRATTLNSRLPLPNALAAGVEEELGMRLSRNGLSQLFADEPFAGIPWLILVDAVDEVLYADDRRRILESIARHRKKSPHVRFFVASRPLPDYHTRRLNTAETPSFTIEPFTEQQLLSFAAGWFAALRMSSTDDTSVAFVEQLQRAGILQLAQIPLLATMLCVLFASNPEGRLPLNRTALYEKFVEQLLSKARETVEIRDQLHRQARPYGKVAEGAIDRLLDNLLLILSEQAYRQSQEEGPLYAIPMPDERVVEVLACPDGIPRDRWEAIVDEALRQSGLLLMRGGEPVFIHQTVREYLTAFYIAGRCSPPRRFRRQDFLIPQNRWPWPDAEVQLFLAAIWTSRKINLQRPLARLLNSSNRSANVGFVVDLKRYGIQLPVEIERIAVESFTNELSRRQSGSQWTIAINSLLVLDEARCMATLENLIVGSGVDGFQRWDAARTMLKIDVGRGIRALDAMIDHDWSSYEVLMAAQTLREHDHNLGVEALRRISRREGAPGARRLDAARELLVHDPEGCLDILDFLARDFTATSTDRLESARLLTNRDQSRGCAVLAILVGDERIDDSSRLSAAELLLREGSGLTKSVLMILLDGPAVAVSTRLEASRIMSRVDPAIAVLRFEAIVDDSNLDIIHRGDAARALHDLGHPDPTHGLRAAAVDIHLSPKERFEAARVIADVDRIDGLSVLVALAKDDAFAGRYRAEASTVVNSLDSAVGVEVFAYLAASITLRADRRLDAAIALNMVDSSRGHAAFVDIASTVSNGSIAISAAVKVGYVDKSSGLRLLTRLARNQVFEHAIRARAVKEIRRVDALLGMREGRILSRDLEELIDRGGLTDGQMRSIRKIMREL